MKNFAVLQRRQQLAAIAKSDASAAAVAAIVRRAWRDVRAELANATMPERAGIVARKIQLRLLAMLGQIAAALGERLETMLRWAHGQNREALLAVVPRRAWIDLARQRSGQPQRESVQEQTQRRGPALGPFVIDTSDWLAILAADEADADDEVIRELIRQVLLPPPTKAEVKAVIERPVAGVRWIDRIQTIGDDFDTLSRQIQLGISSGENVEQLTQRVRPLVEDRVYYQAARIARTESLRVAQDADREQWRKTPELFVGRRLVATMDERLRPSHRANVGANGKREFRRGDSPGPPIENDGLLFTVDEFGCPETPYAPNCRCYAEPIGAWESQ